MSSESKGKSAALRASRKTFSLFRFPADVLSSIQLSSSLNKLSSVEEADDNTATSLLGAFAEARLSEQPTCHTCGGVEFDSVELQRAHTKTPWHRRNLDRKMEWRRKAPDANLSLPSSSALSSSYPWAPLSGDDPACYDEPAANGGRGSDSDDSASDDDAGNGVVAVPRRRGGSELSAGLLWLTSGSQATEAYGVHRRILVPRGTHGIHVDARQVLAELRAMQATDASASLWAFVAMNGGYFAGAVIDTRSGDLVAHKTIVRYTTRRKQGGTQSRQDSAMGHAANSAGAQIRRHNEQRLQEEIHQLMADWRPLLAQCRRVLVRVPRTNRRAFFGPALSWDDPRICLVPVPMARPSLAELRRVYALVTSVTLATVKPPVPAQPPLLPDSAVPLAGADDGGTSGSESECTLEPEPRPDLLAFLYHAAKMIQDPALSDDDIVAYLCEHLEQFLNALSDPAVGLRYLTLEHAGGGIQAHRTPTLLHLASLAGRADLVPFLMDNGEDPTVTNGRPPLYAGGATAYEVARDRRTRDAFRVYRAEHEGEPDGIEWDRARVPPPLTREQVRENEDRVRAKKRRDKERQRAKDKERREALDRERLAAQADDEAMDQALAANHQQSKLASSGRRLPRLSESELRARMLSAAYASAGSSWAAAATSHGANVPAELPRRPVSPATQRAIDRELRASAANRRMQQPTVAAVANTT
ncbi:hypothetical protein EV174_005181, partial [Coemansia sp. RSA 2320]